MANERKKITMIDIAREANVSQSTVSRVINQQPGINEAKYRKVMEAMKRLGYAPPQSAGSPRKTICLVICPLPEQKDILEMSFNIQMQEGVRAVLNAHDAGFMLLVKPYGTETLDLPPEKMRQISGFILLLGSLDSPKLRKELEHAGIPYVIALGGTLARFPAACDIICPDEFNAAHQICDYLEANGRKRIGFLLSRIFAHRLDGFRLEVMKRNSLELRESDIVLLETTDNKDHIEAAYHYLQRGDLPDALIVSFHEAAVLIRSIFSFNGIRVPEDVTIVSYAHTKEQDQIPCILQRAYLLGTKSARRILEKLEEPDDVPDTILIPSELINTKRKQEALS